MANKYKIIILDRDGVINEDSDAYIKSPEEWNAIPGSLEAIVKLNKAGYKIIVISNQSGIARGYFSEKTLELIHDKMNQELAKIGGLVDHIYYCPHHPDDNCECRKPKTKNLLEVLNKYRLHPKDVLMIGDSWVDMKLAENVGCDFVLVKTGKGQKTYINHKKELTKAFIFDNLAEVVAKKLNIR